MYYYEINWDLGIEVALLVALIVFLVWGYTSGDV